MTSIPEWMRPRTTPEDWHISPVALGFHNRKRVSVARRAAGEFARLLSDMPANEAIASKPGLLQRIDARLKVVGLIGLLVLATVLRSIPALMICCAGCVALAALSRVTMRRLGRVWLVAPLFSAVVMLPAVLNVITPGNEVIHLPWKLAITDAGLVVAVRFILRTTVCITLAMLLTVTTKPARLFRGLRGLGVPRVFVMLLMMMERYLVVLARCAEEIHLAKISRSISPGSLREEQVWVAAGMGSLFRRTRSLGQAVYLAMISRGFTGEVLLLNERKEIL